MLPASENSHSLYMVLKCLESLSNFEFSIQQSNSQTFGLIIGWIFGLRSSAKWVFVPSVLERTQQSTEYLINQATEQKIRV